MPEKSVIQMTAERHKEIKEETLDMCHRHMILISPQMPSAEEQTAFMRGVADGFAFATFAILRDGNCKFESGAADG